MMTERKYAETVYAMEHAVEAEVRSAIEGQKATILGGLGFVARMFAAPLWTAILALAPLAARVAVRVLLGWIMRMSVAELLDFIDRHRVREAGPKGDAR